MAEYVYGRNTVLTKLRVPGVVLRLYLSSNVKEIVDLAHKNKIEIEWSNNAYLSSLVKGSHQGVVALVHDYRYCDFDQLLMGLDMNSNPLLVMCDGLEDPHNLGAILRTCEACGVSGVIIGKNRQVAVTDTVAKVAQGAVDLVKISRVTNLVNTIKRLKEYGFWIVGCDNCESSDYRLVPSDRPLVLIVGSEGRGISRLVLNECDYRVKIFMLGQINSLNVSVATGILLYSIMEKRISIDGEKC